MSKTGIIDPAILARLIDQQERPIVVKVYTKDGELLAEFEGVPEGDFVENVLGKVL